MRIRPWRHSSSAFLPAGHYPLLIPSFPLSLFPFLFLSFSYFSLRVHRLLRFSDSIQPINQIRSPVVSHTLLKTYKPEVVHPLSRFPSSRFPSSRYDLVSPRLLDHLGFLSPASLHKTKNHTHHLFPLSLHFLLLVQVFALIPRYPVPVPSSHPHTVLVL